MWTVNFQMLKVDLEKAEEPHIKLPTSLRSSKKAREFPQKIYFCFIDYAKALDCWITTKCAKLLKRWEYQATLPASWEICMQVKEQLELDVDQHTGFKLVKEYVKAVYCHPAYLTYKQITSWEMPGCMKHKLKSRLLGEISITSDSLVAQMVKRLPAMWETWVRFLGREDPLEKEMATHSSTLAWKIPWMEEPDRLQFMGL